ncbi:delta-type opioid receptor-like [Crassostrea angulata]|uniref:delta-type opioid receptor-like n=1 Tax=Magallana angulata TaxID=2784310 RepID=UPI0022B16AFD|nr:delta-type opioid receptor-like [Crassostrea angulata]
MLNVTENGEQLNYTTLEELNNLKVHQRMPTIVFLFILIPFGVIGNIVTILVYGLKYRPSTFRVYLLTLAIVDLLSCCIGIPVELADNLLPLVFYDEKLCKIGKFSGQILKIGSALIIFLMAVCRYQKIRWPLSTNISTKLTRNLCIFTMFVAVLFSWPFLILKGTQYKHSDGGVIGYKCSTDSDVKHTIYPFVYTIVTFGVYMFVFFSLLILYTLIILNIRRHNKAEVTEHKINPRITKIMIAITVAFVVSYLPDCILDANSTFNKGDTIPNTPLVVGSLSLLARLYFVNNVVNPIIYYIGDKTFRKIIKQTCLRVSIVHRSGGVSSSNLSAMSDTYRTEDYGHTDSKHTKAVSNAQPTSPENSDTQL